MASGEALPVMLAIETSQRAGGVAARDASGRVEVEPLASGRDRDIGRGKGHDRELMPAIDGLLRRMELRPDELRIVAVSVGPGGFTGLRIAVSVAKMLGEVLGTPLVAVPSALVAAEPVTSSGPIGVALASKRGEFWLAQLIRADGAWSVTGTPGLVDSDRFDPSGFQALIADAYFPEAARRRCEEAGVPVVDPVFDPAACLTIGTRMWARGETISPEALLPIYPRQPEAVSLWERRAANR